MKSEVDRFWAKVRRGERAICWTWMGALNSSGYGVFGSGGKLVLAHRYSYRQANPTASIDGQLVMHSCDNRRCVNPDHLSIGNSQDNVQDMHAKGRQARKGGKGHGRAVLTWADVRYIRATYSGKYGELKFLCGKYEVTKSTLRAMLLGRTWIEGPELQSQGGATR